MANNYKRKTNPLREAEALVKTHLLEKSHDLEAEPSKLREIIYRVATPAVLKKAGLVVSAGGSTPPDAVPSTSTAVPQASKRSSSSEPPAKKAKGKGGKPKPKGEEKPVPPTKEPALTPEELSEEDRAWLAEKKKVISQLDEEITDLHRTRTHARKEIEAKLEVDLNSFSF